MSEVGMDPAKNKKSPLKGYLMQKQYLGCTYSLRIHLQPLSETCKRPLIRPGKLILCSCFHLLLAVFLLCSLLPTWGHVCNLFITFNLLFKNEFAITCAAEVWQSTHWILKRLLKSWQNEFLVDIYHGLAVSRGWWDPQTCAPGREWEEGKR